MRLLLDANVPRSAAVSAYKKIREQTTIWGPTTNTRDVLEWGPPPYEKAPKFFRRNVPYIPALAEFSRSNDRLVFYTYHLIEMEFWNVRPSFDWANRDIRGLFKCEELPCNFDTSGLLASADPDTLTRYLNSFPGRAGDKTLTNLIDELGVNYSRDCLHMWFADQHALGKL